MKGSRSTPRKRTGLHIRYGWAILDGDGSFSETPSGGVFLHFYRSQAVMAMRHNKQRIVKARIVTNGRRA